jgi:hypothetical protein
MWRPDSDFILKIKQQPQTKWRLDVAASCAVPALYSVCFCLFSTVIIRAPPF